MAENLSSELTPTPISIEEFSNYEIKESLKSSSQVNALYKASNGGNFFILKGIKKSAGNEERHLTLLHREYTILSSLDNPYIIHTNGIIHHPDAGECIILEYIDGRNLDAYLKEKHSAQERRKVLDQLLEALEYIHKKGIIHADLKDSNIMIRHNGDYVVLIDFGLSDSDATIQKNPGHTAAYASPEQKNGTRTNYATDIYSLGKIIEEIFPNRYKHISSKCLNPNPSNRYSDIGEIRKAIDRADKLHKAFGTIIPAAILTAAACFAAGIFTAPTFTEPEVQVKEVHITHTDTVYIQQVDSFKLKFQPIVDQLDAEMSKLCNKYIKCTQETPDPSQAIRECQNPFCDQCYYILVKYKRLYPDYAEEIEGVYNTKYSFYWHKISDLIKFE